MSQLAVEHDAINLGQGFPDYPMSADLTGLVYKAMTNGHNQYVHMNGLRLLRERLSEKIQKLYNADVHPDSQITITPGGTYAIYTALTTILQRGDEVIVFEPAYDSYIPNIEINGAKPVLISLQYPAYNIPCDEVKKKVHQFNCFSCNSPVQFALADYLQNEEAYLRLGNFMQQKRDYFRKLMQQTPFKVIPSHGSYFECYNYNEFTDEADYELAIRLTKEYGVATIPMSSFYKDGIDNKVLRFCVCKKEETLERAVEKLVKSL